MKRQFFKYLKCCFFCGNGWPIAYRTPESWPDLFIFTVNFTATDCWEATLPGLRGQGFRVLALAMEKFQPGPHQSHDYM